MSFRLNREIPLTDIRGRKSLPVRYGPYWEILSYGRALGYQRHSAKKTFWTARIRLKNGQDRWRRMGKTNDNHAADGVTHLCYQDALLAAERWFSDPKQSKVATDTFPVGRIDYLKITPSGDIYTVGHAIRDFLTWKKISAAHSHYMTLISYANCHIMPRIGNIPLKEFNGLMFQEFAADVLTTPPRPGNTKPKPNVPLNTLSEEQLRKRKKTVNGHIGLLRQSIRMAWENGKFDNDRAWRCIRHLPNVDKPRTIHINRDECRRLLSFCADDLRKLVLGALYTGARASELVKMEAGQFNRDRGGVYIPPGKTRRERFTYLPDEGYAFFDRITKGKPSDELIFRRSSGNRWFTNYRHGLEFAAKKANLSPQFTFHSLRHTYASQLIQTGTPPIVVSQQLGHVNANQVNRTYGHLIPQIRESEVRQRFATIIEQNIPAAITERPTYAVINDLGIKDFDEKLL